MRLQQLEITECDLKFAVRRKEVRQVPGSREISTEEIRQLIEQLGACDSVRLRAEHTLVRIGDPAVDLLIEATRDERSGVRESAAWVLGQMEAPRSLDALERLLHDSDHHVRIYAVGAIGNIGGERATDMLVEVIKRAEEDEDAADHAAGFFGWMEEPAAPILLGIWRTGSNAARSAIAYQLGETADPSIADEIAPSLADPQIRLDTAVALGMLGDSRALAPLVDCLRSDFESYSASNAQLGLIGLGGSAVEPLLDVARRFDDERRLEALEVLGKIGDASAIEPLRDLECDDGDRLIVTCARAKCGDLSVADQLLAMLRDARDPAECDPEDYVDIAGAVGRLGKPVIGQLAEIAATGNRYAREEAADALSETGETEAIEPLATMLDDPDANIRVSAVGNLGLLADSLPRESKLTCLELIENRLKNDPELEVRGESALQVICLRSDLGLPANPLAEEAADEWTEEFLRRNEKPA